MTNRIITLLLAAVTFLLVSCGGGGGGDSTPSATAPVTPTSYWKMDSFFYANGGNSAQSTNVVGSKTLTVAVVSTATLSGGDTSNGAYSGSALTFSLIQAGPGTYNIVPDRSTLINGTTTVNPITVESNIGIAVTTGSSLYAASSGQITVTRDTSGKYHFDSVGAVPTTKTISVLGGVAGSPTTMLLSIKDAF
jgi:hypothetical protein